jgi:ribosome-associated protein
MIPTVISLAEVEFTAMRAQGPGGQNVHKVSSAVHLRFDIRASSLPQEVKERLCALPDQRIRKDGVIVIKAQTSRSQEKNKAEAMERLYALVVQAAHRPRVRHPTKPTFGARQRRLHEKAARSSVKATRGRIAE